MSLAYQLASRERDVLRIPVIRIAFVLSIVFHAAALWPWMKPLMFLSPPDDSEKAASRFQVRLAPTPQPSVPARVLPPPSSASARGAVPRRPAPAKANTRTTPPSSEPVLAQNAPAPARTQPSIPPPTPLSEPTPTPPTSRATPPALIGDMASLVESRRLLRSDAAPSPSPAPPRPQVQEDENDRRNRILAENLGSQRKPTFGQDTRGSGGIFQIENLYYDSADFLFYGWNRDIRRNTRQLIEVRKGNERDIRIAVVRKMIAIIREYEQEEFRWDSTRLRRSITLSARQRDSAGLEDFLLSEFFEDFQRSR